MKFKNFGEVIRDKRKSLGVARDEFAEKYADIPDLDTREDEYEV